MTELFFLSWGKVFDQLCGKYSMSWLILEMKDNSKMILMYKIDIKSISNDTYQSSILYIHYLIFIFFPLYKTGFYFQSILISKNSLSLHLWLWENKQYPVVASLLYYQLIQRISFSFKWGMSMFGLRD